VNSDGSGNRVVEMIFGLRKAIVVTGKNKIVKNVDEIPYSIKTVIFPQYAKTKNMRTSYV